LRFVNINFQSAPSKVAEISHLLQSLKPDVIFGTETFLASEVATSEVFPPGYKVYRRDRNRKGGSVLLAVLDSLVSTEEPDLSRPNCEIIWVKVKLRGCKDLLLGSYYRPDVSDEGSLRELDVSLRLACSSDAIIVLGGDFNLPGWDWETKTLKASTPFVNLHHHFKDLLDDLGLDQIVEEPTRDKNTLDLYVTNRPNLFPHLEIAPGLSDHAVVYAEFQLRPLRIRQKVREVPCYKKANWEGLRASVKKLSDNVIETHTDEPDFELIWKDLEEGL
jgi:hypothetical protein